MVRHGPSARTKRGLTRGRPRRPCVAGRKQPALGREQRAQLEDTRRGHYLDADCYDEEGEFLAMTTMYAVRAVPVRGAGGDIVGWVRADLFADGTKPDDMVILRDGTACGQAEAMARAARDLGLLYPTEAEAVRDGIARLRAADALGDGQPL